MSPAASKLCAEGGGAARELICLPACLCKRPRSRYGDGVGRTPPGLFGTRAKVAGRRKRVGDELEAEQDCMSAREWIRRCGSPVFFQMLEVSAFFPALQGWVGMRGHAGGAVGEEAEE